MDLAKTLAEINLEKITDPEIRLIIGKLFVIIENLYQENQLLKKTNQELRDEVNRLKGEQGKPHIKPNATRDVSSEGERKQAEAERSKKKERRKKRKKQKKATRQQKCQVDKTMLPPDIVFKGFESQIIPEVRLEIEYVEYLREKYYSPSQNKTYIAPLPTGSSREFGASVRTLVIAMKYELNTTESAIASFLNDRGLDISAATISRMLTKDLDLFHQEKEDIFQSGLQSQPFVQTDDTGARVNGKNQHTHIFCSNRFSTFFTEPKKDRMTILDILRMGKDREYIINTEALDLLRIWKLPEKRMVGLSQFQSDRIYNQPEFDSLLQRLFPNREKLQSYQKLIQEAAYIARYHKEDCITALVSDHAPQFKFIGLFLSLCWVHEGRHYKRMQPIIPDYQKQLAEFRCLFWQFYKKLLDYRDHPTEQLTVILGSEFDDLCNFETTYSELKERISKTRANKTELLYVLKDPSVPLHNNTSELAARQKVRDRDIRLHTISAEGTKANDTFLTLKDTARKQSVGFMAYVYDRLSGTYNLPSLADLIAHNQSDFSLA